ncbi:uncharacterized protein LOC142541601 [Primulina tabacum]|uniref:uncharacterized protein LOC142541601 n=1 Tax=Primulina tabacum TaxID=48773 RepID=UPI003F5A2FC1
MERSFVSRARTAIHSAAAKAEKVFTDIKKPDSITHRDLDEQAPRESTPVFLQDADAPKLQVINCCISRKRRYSAAIESLDNVTAQASSMAEESSAFEGTVPLDPNI